MLESTLDEWIIHCEDALLMKEQEVLDSFESGLSVHQASILESILSHPTYSMKSIAQANSISPSTLSIDVKTLIKNGWLTRTHNSLDKRVTGLHCTPKTKKILDSIFEMRKETLQQLSNQVSSKDLEVACKVLSSFYEIIK